MRPRLVIIRAIRLIPAFLRMMGGLLRDPRVAASDKLLVGAALAYFALPLDFVADFIPFAGVVDDVFLLSLTIRRLMRNAGRRRLLRHWPRSPAELSTLRVEEIITAAALLLPRGVAARIRSKHPLR